MKFFGSKDIKEHVERILLLQKENLRNKIVIDIPAGSGHSTKILKNIGASVEPFDLFPDFFSVDGLECNEADLSKELPVRNSYADYVLCQEGIEHMPDQLHTLRELNRILKKGGVLLLTTPSYSQLRSRFSYLFSESEYAYKIMPPNEIDSIWVSNNNEKNDIYFGHIFFIGIQKLRVLARIAGFKIKKIHHLRVNHTSLLLLPFFYPFIFLVNFFAYRRAMNIKQDIDKELKKKVYEEIFKLSIDPRILVDGHLFLELEKEFEADKTNQILHSKFTNFDIVT
jgi:SAM-dependent methyltransferase